MFAVNGWIDSSGRALVRIAVKSSARSSPIELDAWVDTGFTGELVLPQESISALGLPQSATVRAELGDGSEVVLDICSCLIEWFGQEKQIEVIASTGQLPLLGVGLLQKHKLIIDYPSRTLALE